jgi:hypothetical protein
MQRRAAAAYLAIFLVVGAGAYAVIGVAEKPQLELDGPTYTEGDELTVDDRTYAVTGVSGGEGAGTLEWEDPDARETVELAHNSTVDWRSVSWEGEPLESVELSAGSTVRFNGSFYRVETDALADPPTMTLTRVTNDSINATFELGESVTVADGGRLLSNRLITDINAAGVTLSVGDDYRVTVPNESDPDTATLTQDLNVTRRLLEAPTLDNQTFVDDDGEEFVRNKETGETIPLSEFLPEAESDRITEGDTLTFEGNELTVGNITRDAVPLNRTVTATNEVDLEATTSLALGPEDHEFIVQFPANDTVRVVENTTSVWNDYQSQQAEIDSYNERINGLWGLVFITFLGGLILGGAAFLPVKD